MEQLIEFQRLRILSLMDKVALQETELKELREEYNELLIFKTEKQ